MRFRNLLLTLILGILPNFSFAQLIPSDNPDFYFYDYGCWGTIDVYIGEEITVKHKYDIPYSYKLKSLIWSDWGDNWDNHYYWITQQSESSCTIEGNKVVNGTKLWCLMQYGESSTYKAYYNVNVKSRGTTTVTASPNGGTVVRGTIVKLSATPSDAKIYYTTDGSTPSSLSMAYTSDGVAINRTTTLKAVAFKSGYARNVFSADYTVSDTFTEKTVEGVDMNFKITKCNNDEKNCKVVINAIDKNTTGNITIPSEVNGFKVTEIEQQAFKECKGITSITIPNTITKIGYAAFQGCHDLTSVNIPNSVTSLGSEAFRGCSSLESIIIPNSVTSISEYTFQDCTSLSSVSIPNSVTFIGSSAFSGCTNLPSIVLPNSVTDIKAAAFSRCTKLESVTLSTSLKRIESGTFQLCPLKTIKGYSNIEYIGSYAITTTCPWAENLPDGMNFFGKVLFKYKGEMPANTILRIPEGCTQILTSFYKQSGLTELYIPGSVLSMPGSLTDQCPNLQKITVDASNTVYDSRNNCNAIIETATNTLIQGCSSTTIPTTVTSIGSAAFRGNWTKDEIVIPNQIDSIANIAFVNCSNVKSILIGKGLRKIGVNAFALLPNLKEIAVSAGNPYLDSRDNCNAIIEKATNTLLVGCSTTTIPHTVKTIGVQPFYGNGDENFTSLVIPNSVEEIQLGAFGHLTHLREVSIGANVKTFGNSIFYLSNNLEAIESLNGFPDDIDEKVFDSGSKDFSIYDNVTLYVPAGCRNNYRLATGWSKFKNIVEGHIPGPTPDGIDGIPVPQPEEFIYSPTGVRLSAPQRGVNIVNGRKLLVK